MRAILILLATALALAPVSSAQAARARSPFAVRGIVEGAYGRPWTAPERERMLRWMGAHGMNAYVHAPKDDLFSRTQWRDPYPADQQRDFDREVALARSLGIDWIPDISPALPLIPTAKAPAGIVSRPLCFSCPEDLAAVRAKFAPFVRAGARVVAVSFDDVTKAFADPRDLAHYGAGDEAYGTANGEFLSALARSYAGEGVRVLSVGADYSGTKDTLYLRGLRTALAPGVEMMWTGTGVPADAFTPKDAADYAHHVGREPIVWDNWTNTDTAGSIFGSSTTTRIFLGPYLRSPDVRGSVRGFLLNPANEAALNLLPLATAADWLADPGRYRPDASWRRSLRALTPGRADLREPLRAFAETMWSTKLDRMREAPTFSAARDRTLAAYDGTGAWPAPMRALQRELDLVVRAPQALAALPDRELHAELVPYLDAAARAASGGRVAADLLAAERPSLALDPAAGRGRASAPDPQAASALRGRLARARAAFDTDTRFAYGWRLPQAFEVPPYSVGRNAMSLFLEAAAERDGHWLATGSGTAAGSLTVTVDGRPVDPAGFAVRCGERVEAVDGAGGRTVEVVSCPPASARPTARARSRTR